MEKPIVKSIKKANITGLMKKFGFASIYQFKADFEAHAIDLGRYIFDDKVCDYINYRGTQIKRTLSPKHGEYINIIPYAKEEEYEMSEISIENQILKKWSDPNISPENIDRPNPQDGIYDGNQYEIINDEVKGNRYVLPSQKRMGFVSLMDSKLREGKAINLLKLVAYLASIEEIREIVYNNSWGIVVRAPKKDNYPEQVVLNTIKEIIMEGLRSDAADREKVLLFWSSAPSNSIAGKTWNMLPDANLQPITYLEEKELEHDEIPAEDVEFWRNIYRTRKDLTLGIDFKVC